MVFEKIWVSQNFTQILWVSQSRFCLISILVSQSKNSKSLGLAGKNASLAVSQSLEFTIRHPFFSECFLRAGADQKPSIDIFWNHTFQISFKKYVKFNL